MKSKSKWLTLVATLAVVCVLVLSLGLSSIFANAADEPEYEKVRYYSDYNSYDEAYEAAEATNLSLAEEGIVMLKNDGTLPLSKGAKVSVLGIAQDCLCDTDGTVTESLSNAGFKVNPTLESKYLSDGATSSSFGSESELNGVEKESLKGYSDAAIVVISRGISGEGSGNRSMNTGEVDDDTYLGEDQGWSHEAHFGTENEEYKHLLQLTKSEEELIAVAEECCDKVIVLFSGPSTFEMANLEDDPAINGIAYIGQLGYGGIDAIGEILSGAVSPSGKVADEWNRDFTNDPTYANAFNFYMNNSNTSSDLADSEEFNRYAYAYTDEKGNKIDVTRDGDTGILISMGNYYATGIDYEEDIYLGYKFYETYWAEADEGTTTGTGSPDGYTAPTPQINGDDITANGDESVADIWYDYNVVYPFGYGLSYADFSYDIVGVKTNKGASLMESGGNNASISTLDLSSSTESSATVSDITVSVEVTNESAAFSGKEVVEVYMEAPYYAGGTEKAYVSLVGFAKTKELKPGQSEVVDITIATQDFASYDYADMNEDSHTGYELDEGDYTIHVMESSSHENMDEDNPAYASCTFEVASNFAPASTSGAVSAAHLDLDDYSDNEIENLFSGSVGEDDTWKDDYYSMVLADECESMISPLAAQADDSDQTESTMLSRSNMAVLPTAPEGLRKLSDHGSNAALKKLEYMDASDPELDAGQVWEKTIDNIPSTWTQGTGTAGADGMYQITLDDMSGVPFNDDLWTDFMNQLTWDEIATLVSDGYHNTLAIPTIGKIVTADENGPNHTGGNHTFYWVGEPSVAATWNQDLCYDYGRMAGNMAMYHGLSGWYAPGMNIHRNQFAGRCGEYYSQDGMLSGFIGAAVVRGATDKGINVYVKHFALYDATSCFSSTFIQLSEQNLRENYLKPFQMSMQEGGAHAAMTAVVCIGGVIASQNYALIQALARDEWGWTGFTVTDMASTLPGVTVDGLVRAGAELPDGNESRNTKPLSGEWDGTYIWTDDQGEPVTDAPKGAVMVGEGESAFASATQWYCGRMAAQRILYNEANSIGNNNGITASSAGVTMNLTQGASGSATLLDLGSGEFAGHLVTSSSVSSGSLVDGMVLDGNTLSGTPTSTESGSAVVTVYVDGWIPIEVTVTFSVTAVMSMGTDISSAATGASVSAYVVPAESLGATSYSVSISDGALPQGLSLNEATGQISGTPEKAGVYDFTLALTVDGAATYYMPYTITVTGDDYTASSSVTSEELEKAIEDALADLDLGGMTSADIEKAVSEAVEAAMGSTSSDEGSSGNGLAITGLVLGIVAIVLAAAVLVIVLLRRNKKED